MCLGNKPGFSSACKMKVSAIGSLKTLWMPKLSDSTVTFVCPLTVLTLGNTVMLPFSAVPPVSLQALTCPPPFPLLRVSWQQASWDCRQGPSLQAIACPPVPGTHRRPGPPWQVWGCVGSQVVVSAHILLFLHFSQCMGNSPPL